MLVSGRVQPCFVVSNVDPMSKSSCFVQESNGRCRQEEDVGTWVDSLGATAISSKSPSYSCRVLKGRVFKGRG